MIQNKIDIRPYLQIVRRRLLWILLPTVLSIIGGVFYVLDSEKMYRSSTLILVEAQRVPENYVEPTVTEGLESRLQTISQQVHSRTSIERIINEFDLFEKKSTDRSLVQKLTDKLSAFLGESNQVEASESSEMSLLEKVKAIRQRINVAIRSQNRAFEISFDWHNPETAARIANAIASQFIEQNLRVREEMAMGTTRFLQSEVSRLRRELESKEKQLESFKQKNMGRLPSQLQSNLNILSQLKEELSNLEQRLAMEKQQAMFLRNQIDDEMRLASASGTSSGSGGQSGNDLPALRQRLDELQSKYTERHPDVVDLKRQIAKLEMKSEGGDTSGTTGAGTGAGNARDPRTQLVMIEARIDNYEAQISEIKQEMESYKKRVEQTSQVEMQLRDLERDYQTVNQRYQDLLSKKLNAQMAEELEKNQKGEQFRVIDSAVPPEHPYKPDVNKIMLMAVLLGFGLGGGLAYVRESLDPSFYTPEELEKFLKVKVVATLPMVDKATKRNR